MTRALLIIDVQNDFCPGGALAVPDGDAVVSVINRLQPSYDLVLATQDWHPENHGSFAVNHPGAHPGDVVELGGIPQTLWPTHCVQGTLGAQFHPALDTRKVGAIFRKGTRPEVDSYSAFYDNARANDLGVAAYLRAKGVDEVHVAGLATDYCVKFTALDARSEGFEVGLVEDGCRAVNLSAGDGERAVRAMREAGVRLISCELPA